MRLAEVRYDGIVRYDKALEGIVSDVRGYIAAQLNRQVAQVGRNVVMGRLYSPVEIPLPE